MDKFEKVVFIDTNILFPTVLIPKGTVGKFFFNFLIPHFKIVTSDYVLKELETALRRKRHKEYRKSIKNLRNFVLPNIEVISTPEVENIQESFIADIKDRPVLRAALESEAEEFLTEDKDFLRERENIEGIKILNIDEFKGRYLF